MNKYKFMDIYGDCNLVFFRDLENVEFEARDDKSAYNKIAKFQHKCEMAVKRAGLPLTQYDPCLWESVYKNVKGYWVSVEF